MARSVSEGHYAFRVLAGELSSAQVDAVRGALEKGVTLSIEDHPHVSLLERFYTAFQQRDADAMGACYAAEVRFQDPVFTLEGSRARAMWRMLCERGRDLRVEFRVISADDTAGAAHWEAWYTFSGTGRHVHNVIEASFTFAGGRIIAHHDGFDFYRWARQALGWTGVLLGWTPLVRATVRRKAAAALESYIHTHGLDLTT